jgi:hypothetical protein
LQWGVQREYSLFIGGCSRKNVPSVVSLSSDKSSSKKQIVVAKSPFASYVKMNWRERRSFKNLTPFE